MPSLFSYLFSFANILYIMTNLEFSLTKLSFAYLFPHSLFNVYFYRLISCKIQGRKPLIGLPFSSFLHLKKKSNPLFLPFLSFPPLRTYVIIFTSEMECQTLTFQLYEFLQKIPDFQPDTAYTLCNSFLLIICYSNGDDGLLKINIC